MKGIIIALLILPNLAIAQMKGNEKVNIIDYIFPVNDKNEVELIYIDSVSHNKNELFDLIQKWGQSYFSNYSQTVQVEDKEHGRLILAAPIVGDNTTWYYKTTIDIKDGRYRVKVDNLRWTSIDGIQTGEEYNAEFKRLIDKGKTEVRYIRVIDYVIAKGIIDNMANDLNVFVHKEKSDSEW